MIGELDADGVVEYFRGKSILITGSTGFLGKVLVEKMLRVQHDVKKLFLLVRANDVESSKQRVQTEIARENGAGLGNEAERISERRQVLFADRRNVLSQLEIGNPSQGALFTDTKHQYC